MRSRIKLILWLVLIWGFIKVGPKFMDTFATYKAMVSNSESMGIDNAALFYSEEPHSLAAEKKMKEQLKDN